MSIHHRIGSALPFQQCFGRESRFRIILGFAGFPHGKQKCDWANIPCRHNLRVKKM
jgi:hypothetical protein